ncbi:unnamed protein product [Microthlaspi erraticum]|uniref:Uncharacterized protein n=1 Tax=Microthlaspi erraticum TaxID=1685480 RepID=A0A6D2HJ53_9BRAS|nr:unnamed protein product [Microthlaspi erraticum]
MGKQHEADVEPNSEIRVLVELAKESTSKSNSDEATNGVNDVKHDVEIPTPKSKHELKGKRVMEEGVSFESKTRGLGIVGFTYHGFSRDGGSSSLKGDMGPNPNSRKRAVGVDEGLDLDQGEPRGVNGYGLGDQP